MSELDEMRSKMEEWKSVTHFVGEVEIIIGDYDTTAISFRPLESRREDSYLVFIVPRKTYVRETGVTMEATVILNSKLKPFYR